MGKAKNTAWSTEFGNLWRREGENSVRPGAQQAKDCSSSSANRHCAALDPLKILACGLVPLQKSGIKQSQLFGRQKPSDALLVQPGFF